MAGWIPEQDKTPERKMMDRAAREARSRRDFKTADRIEAEIRRYEHDRKKAADREKQRRNDQIEGYIKGAAIVGGVYAASKAVDVLGKPSPAVNSLLKLCFFTAVGMTAWTLITEGPEGLGSQEEPAVVEIVEPVKQPTLSKYELQIREAEAQRNFAEPVEKCYQYVVTDNHEIVSTEIDPVNCL